MYQRACACEGNNFFAAQHGPQKVLEYVQVAEFGDERLEEDKHELAVHVDRQRAIKVQIVTTDVGALEGDVDSGAVVRVKPGDKFAPPLALA
eukprot:3665369-Pleurochrysis_carterae.AAC.1